MIFAATSFSKMLFFGRQTQSVKLALLSSFSFKSVLKSSVSVTVWKVGLTVEIKLRFQIALMSSVNRLKAPLFSLFVIYVAASIWFFLLAVSRHMLNL